MGVNSRRFPQIGEARAEVEVTRRHSESDVEEVRAHTNLGKDAEWDLAGIGRKWVDRPTMRMSQRIAVQRPDGKLGKGVASRDLSLPCWR